MTARLGILVSGRGSNMEALAAACSEGRIPATIALVLSNVESAPALEKARRAGLATMVVASKGRGREEHERLVTQELERAGASLVCLAGYMRLLTGSFVRRWDGKVLNVHPSLLPAFPGMNAQAQAVAHGVKVSGCTVHFVDEELDHGPIILQAAVPVLDDDTPDSLSARILDVEHRVYPEAVALVASGRVRLEGGRVVRA